MKTTFEIRIHRTDYSREANKGCFIPFFDEHLIVVQFQAEKGTTSTCSLPLEIKETTGNLYLKEI